MNYHQRNRRKKKPVAIILVLFGVLLLLFFFSPLHSFGTFFHFIGRPIWKVENSVSEGLSEASYFSSKAKLEKENRELKERLRDLEPALLRLSVIEAENRAIKAELGRREEKDTILAYVLRGPGVTPYDTYIVDAGEKEGVAAGSPVFLENIRIGFIEEVYPHTSKVKLASSPGEEMEVEIVGSHLIVRAVGEGNGTFKITLPKDIEVPLGTLILAPGIENGVLGIIEDVEHDLALGVDAAYFRYSFNIHELKRLYIQR